MRNISSHSQRNQRFVWGRLHPKKHYIFFLNKICIHVSRLIWCSTWSWAPREISVSMLRPWMRLCMSRMAVRRYVSYGHKLFCCFLHFAVTELTQIQVDFTEMFPPLNLILNSPSGLILVGGFLTCLFVFSFMFFRLRSHRTPRSHRNPNRRRENSELVSSSSILPSLNPSCWWTFFLHKLLFCFVQRAFSDADDLVDVQGLTCKKFTSSLYFKTRTFFIFKVHVRSTHCFALEIFGFILVFDELLGTDLIY